MKSSLALFLFCFFRFFFNGCGRTGRGLGEIVALKDINKNGIEDDGYDAPGKTIVV